MDMTIKELLKKQKEAEQQITSVINNFVKETGVTVSEIEFERLRKMSGWDFVVNLKVDVSSVVDRI
jgi:hypothetical protein